MTSSRVRIRRVYDEPSPDDGYRVLVDRLWPRGVSKSRARLHTWMPEVAPSAELRRWFGHDPDRWEQFRQRYAEELSGVPDELARLVSWARTRRVTLVFAAIDVERNNAVVLRDVLDDLLRSPGP